MNAGGGITQRGSLPELRARRSTQTLASAEAAGPHVLRLPTELPSPSRRPPPHTPRRSPTKTSRHPKTTDSQHQPSKSSQPRHLRQPAAASGWLPNRACARIPAACSGRLPRTSARLPRTSARISATTSGGLSSDTLRLPSPSARLPRLRGQPPGYQPPPPGATQCQRRDILFSRLKRPCLNSRRRSDPRPLAG